MILTCPECATSYYVDDGRIPAGGRTVKCTSCNARWHAGAEAEPAAAPETAPIAEAEDVAAEAAPAAEAPADDLEVTGPESTGLRKRPAAAVAAAAKAALGPETGPLGAVVAWGGMAALVAVLVVGAIVFRGEVVRFWPKSYGAYAGVGLPVNGLGLVIEDVKAEPTFQGGRPVLAITGRIRNVADHPADAPSLRIDLLNKAGKSVAAKLAKPIDPRIPAGALRHFAISIVDPPSTAHDLQVAFEPAAKGRPADPHATEAVLTPAPVEAEPLPAGAPDALPSHG